MTTIKTTYLRNLWSMVILVVLTITITTIHRADAVSMRHDVSEQAYLDFGAQFPAVCQLIDLTDDGIGTGTLVSPTHILTAAHVLDLDGNGTSTHGLNHQIRFGANTDVPDLVLNPSDIDSIVISPNYAPSEATRFDMALIILKVPVTTITPIPITDVSPENRVGYFGGYGDRGTGLVFPGNPAFDNQRRMAENDIDCTIVGGSLIIDMDFDAPAGVTAPNRCGSATPRALEASTGGGDSGGGLMIDLGGGQYGVVGAHSEGGNNGLDDSEYGCQISWSSVLESSNRTFLESNGITFSSGPITVTTLVDQNDSPAGAQVSLREAMRDVPSGGTIYFDPSLSGEMVLTDTLVKSTNPCTIDALEGRTEMITLRAPSDKRILELTSLSGMTLRGLRFTGAHLTSTPRSGSAIFVTNCTLDFDQCDISSNTNSTANGGGAIALNGSTLTMKSCLIADNRTNDGVAGGILLRQNVNTVRLYSCTLANNFSSDGGGAFADNGTACTIELFSSTVSGNSAASGGQAVDLAWSSIHVAGCIVEDFFRIVNLASVTSGGYNIERATGQSAALQATGDQTGTNPELGPLLDYGGLMRSRAITIGGPAYNAGNPTFNLSLNPFDQRGLSRVVDSRVDIGAFEAGQASGDLVEVNSTTPPTGAIDVSNTTTISATFSAPPNPASVTSGSLQIWGEQGGLYTGQISFPTLDRVVVTPTRAFCAGEKVTVTFSDQILNSIGESARPAQIQFVTEAGGDSDVAFFDSGQALGSARSAQVALGDLDLDGDLDAFVANTSGGNTVWLNSRRRSLHPTRESPSAV